MAAQRSRARCGMIRRRADVVASKTGNCRSDTRVSTRATGGHTRIAALSGNFCNGILLFKSERATLTRRASGRFKNSTPNNVFPKFEYADVTETCLVNTPRA